jgi:hypothetical protein
MRNTFRTAILATLFLAAGCSGYDRALMGDPEPKEPAVATNDQQAPPPATASADSDSMDIGMFNDLDYYGQWYQRDPYGWVYRPTVVMDWQPFTHGHWIWTQYGWMWVDYDPWGWATSHYGYWTQDFTLGWIWVPDYTWSPVQCEWVQYGDYIGWAPEPPPGAAFKEPWEGSQAWVFVPIRKFKQADVASNRADPKFKTGDDPQIARGAPALKDVERRGAGMFEIVDVQLDRRVVHDREFARVKYPPDQEDIIAQHSTQYKSTMTSPASPTVNTSSPGWNNGGGGTDPASVGPPPPPTHGKSKNSGSQKPASSGKTQTKYKSQQKKDTGKSKDDSNSDSKKGKG